MKTAAAGMYSGVNVVRFHVKLPERFIRPLQFVYFCQSVSIFQKLLSVCLDLLGPVHLLLLWSLFFGAIFVGCGMAK